MNQNDLINMNKEIISVMKDMLTFINHRSNCQMVMYAAFEGQKCDCGYDNLINQLKKLKKEAE